MLGVQGDRAQGPLVVSGPRDRERRPRPPVRARLDAKETFPPLLQPCSPHTNATRSGRAKARPRQRPNENGCKADPNAVASSEQFQQLRRDRATAEQTRDSPQGGRAPTPSPAYRLTTQDYAGRRRRRRRALQPPRPRRGPAPAPHALLDSVQRDPARERAIGRELASLDPPLPADPDARSWAWEHEVGPRGLVCNHRDENDARRVPAREPAQPAQRSPVLPREDSASGTRDPNGRQQAAGGKGRGLGPRRPRAGV